MGRVVTLAYSVDRSWGNVRHNANGTPFPSDDRKLHRQGTKDPAMPACGARVVLNNYPGEGLDPAKVPNLLCRRCFPKGATP